MVVRGDFVPVTSGGDRGLLLFCLSKSAVFKVLGNDTTGGAVAQLLARSL